MPGPDATRAEVAAWEARQRAKARSDRARVAALSANRTCSSCGEQGHVRGNSVCPNYDTPVRWQKRGKIWGAP